MVEVKENTLTNTFEFITYIGGDGYTAPIIAKSDGINTPIYLYLHRDYQGTILAVTDANGALVEKRLFDAWGTIIKVQDGAGNTLAGLTVLDRGYTGHEHLQSVGLINMNARLYDPILHRFLQVDNYIQDPTSTQNYNQYGYVLNNPLLYSDPSGNTYQDGKDCANCGSSNELSNGQQTLIGGLISTVVTNWDEWGIKDWANKNINGDKFSKWWKKKVSFNNMFGGGGSNKNSTPAPAPNRSSYVSLNNSSSNGIDLLGVYQWYNRNTTLNFKADIGFDFLKFKGYHYGVPEFETSFLDSTNAAATPGPFVLYPTGGSSLPGLSTHEPGHVLQYRKLGPILYYAAIVIPSMLHVNDPTTNDHYHEKSANTLWYLYTGEHHKSNPRYFFDK
ncbi:RHS repeat domain-containing protein [Flavobacterium sp. ov086]|uniref:RHS repeat domain-containing protein n=1 Tax=Flavobacterium sp. ov086 TaxID=1761785 RepID=UPI000B6617D9|nr:RHS repeat-associated core domain-containing protein [Flavobacterium sp. ov086]SNR73826.1 RHS repeat-associated core domain-containing protein [Flavobacterium sp. ov086]